MRERRLTQSEHVGWEWDMGGREGSAWFDSREGEELG